MNTDLNFRQEGKIVIALSGAIASGKTAALEEFAALGAETICADKLAAKRRAALKEKIKNTVLDINPDDIEFVTNQRQQHCLFRAKTALENALDGANNLQLQDMIYIDVK